MINNNKQEVKLAMKQKVLKGLKIVTRWLACAKSALVLGVIVALITWGMPLATPQFVAKVNGLFLHLMETRTLFL